jgi:hypothetical protein
VATAARSSTAVVVALHGRFLGRRLGLAVLLAQVGADHVGMVLDLGGRADGDGDAEVEGQHPVRQVHDHAHVVLDQDHGQRQLLPDVEDEPGHVLGLLDVHARHGLVQQQQLRLHGQGPTELDPLVDAVGQDPDRQLAVALDLQEVDDVLDHPPVADLLAPGPAKPQQGRGDAVADVEVAAHAGEAEVQVVDLERRAGHDSHRLRRRYCLTSRNERAWPPACRPR